MTKTGLTLSYNSPATASGSGSEKISDVLGFAPSDYSKLTITSGGQNYTYVSDANLLTDNTFTIVDGAVKVKSYAPKSPKEGKGYTLIYEAFDALTASGTYNNSSTSQEVSITVDSGYGKYGDNALSYEQILSDTGLTASSSSSDFANYFTLTDGSGNEYTYGTDFTIAQGSDTDSTSGEHNVMINWINAPANPNAIIALSRIFLGELSSGIEFSR